MLQPLHAPDARRAADAREHASAMGSRAWFALAERFGSAYNAILARRTALRRQTERNSPLSQPNAPTLSVAVRNTSFTRSRSA